MKVVTLSALPTGLLYPPRTPRKYSWYSFLLQAQSAIYVECEYNMEVEYGGLSEGHCRNNINLKVKDCNIYAVQQDTQSVSMSEFIQHLC